MGKSVIRAPRHAPNPAETIDEVALPTVLRLGPYRFFFYARENRASFEAPHIHVRSGGGSASFWLLPVRVRDFKGYTPREISRIRRIVVANQDLLLRRWDEFFGSQS
jgi:hypothetical protein